MRVLILVCLPMFLVGCQYGSSARVALRDGPVFVPLNEGDEADPRWPSGTALPVWYDERDVTADESAGSDRSKFSIEAKILKWRSPEGLEKCLRMFRLEHVSDTEFTLVSDRKARGIASGQLLDSSLTPPKMVLYEGQSACTSMTIERFDRVAGMVLFTKVWRGYGQNPLLSVSAQGTCRTGADPPPAGRRWACWTAQGEQAVQVGKWYLRLAESEDPQFNPIALMVRIAEVTPHTGEASASEATGRNRANRATGLLAESTRDCAIAHRR